MTKRRPTIDDVAAHSGVSRATVSRVVNGGPNVSDAMRARVIAAVETLGFRINQQARALASGGRHGILMICAAHVDREPNSYYQAALEMGALKACGVLGFELATHNVAPDATDRAQRIAQIARDARSLGVILTPPFSDDAAVIAALLSAGFAIAGVSPSPDRCLLPAVSMDDEAAGFALMRRLLDIGHRHFGFIKGLAEHLAAERRYQGALGALREAGLDDTAMIARRGDFTFKAGVELLPELIAAAPRPTAIICANDDTAVGALFAAHRDGLVVPADLSLASFDDTPVSALVWPPLTTVHQPIRQMAGRAVELIAAAQSGKAGDPGVELMPFRIVERRSTAPPRS